MASDTEQMLSNDVPKYPPRIALSEKRLTVILARDEDCVCAFCPELDLVAEMETPEAALEDILEAMQEYAEEYLEDLDLYGKSPNRAHHCPIYRVGRVSRPSVISAVEAWE